LEDDHPLRLIAGRIKGLTLFEFSEEIVSRPIFLKAGSGDIAKGMDVSNKFVLQLIGAIPRFHAESTIAIFKGAGLITEREQSEFREKYCASPDEFKIPLSISSDYIDAMRNKKKTK
jgi:hypothetical protein